MMNRLCALLLVLLGLSACATDRPIAFDGCPSLDPYRIAIAVTPNGRVSLPAAALTPSLRGALSAAPDRAAGGMQNFLVLSGGGKWGAYGAGLLQGWSEQTGANARPVFDVVTGVSTGAMQSTYAFLGRDADLVAAYTIQHESELVHDHGTFFFLTHGSTADQSPLRDRVRHNVDGVLELVAAEAAKHRALLVGTVDATTGQMYAIDLTAIAGDTSAPRERRLECYTAAVVSSAAIPVIFRQVTVGGVPYYDGGVRNSVFVIQVQRALAELSGQLRGTAPPLNLYILFNGEPGVGQKTPPELKAQLLPSLSRLREITFDQIEQTSIYLAYNTATEIAPVAAYTASATGQTCPKPPKSGEDIFNPAFMTCLRQQGHDVWMRGSPWKTYPP
jgi:predicted acylesterase/phospholipase RssA